MARLPYPALEALDPRDRAALERLPPLNVLRMLAHSGAVFRPFLCFSTALLVLGQLDPRLRETAILEVARRTGARYEWVQHESAALAVGVSADDIADIAAGAVGDLAPASAAVVRLTAALVEETRCDEAVLAAARSVLPDAQVVELILLVGVYVTLARLMTHLDLELDESRGADVLRLAARAGAR